MKSRTIPVLVLVVATLAMVSCASKPMFVELSGVPNEIRYRENIELSFSTKPGSLCRADASGALMVGKNHMAGPFGADGHYTTWGVGEEDTLADNDSSITTHLLEIQGEQSRGENTGHVTIVCKLDGESASASFSIPVKPRVP